MTDPASGAAGTSGAASDDSAAGMPGTAAHAAWLRAAFELALVIRTFEERLEKLFAGNLIRGSTHLGIGQEAVAVGEMTPTGHMVRVSSLASRSESYGIPNVSVDGMDALAVREVMGQAIGRARTQRLVLVHEAHRNCGPGAEIAVRVMEQAWGTLRAPVSRVCGLDIPVPYAEPLEAAWLPGAEDVRRAAHKLMDNRPGERGGRDDVHT